MADILIRGMEMPTDCRSCWMRVYCYERGLGIWGCGKGEPCPLVPLQTHGDLYDKNDLDELVGEPFEVFLSRLDLKLPQAIIEAEGVGE